MTKLRAFARIVRDELGTAAIETALVAPVLAMMAIGTFEVGRLLARQQELQSAASEAEGIILAAAGGTGTDSDTMTDVLEDSLGLEPTAANPHPVTLEQRFRCDVSDTLTTDASTCDASTGHHIYRYIRLQVTDHYTPMWTSFGFGSPYTYSVTRTVQVE